MKCPLVLVWETLGSYCSQSRVFVQGEERKILDVIGDSYQIEEGYSLEAVDLLQEELIFLFERAWNAQQMLGLREIFFFGIRIGA